MRTTVQEFHNDAAKNLAKRKFADYVTSSAFNISLSGKQIAVLRMISESHSWVGSSQSIYALYDKGLLISDPMYHRAETDCEHKLSQAGELVLKMIELSGAFK